MYIYIYIYIYYLKKCNICSQLRNKNLFIAYQGQLGASQVALVVTNPPANAGDVRDWVWICFLGGEDPLEEGTAAPSSILAWRIPWTEEPGELQSIGLQRVGQY